MTEKDLRHFETKIRMFEDMLLRSKNVGEQERINKELRAMRIQLSKMRIKKLESL